MRRFRQFVGVWLTSVCLSAVAVADDSHSHQQFSNSGQDRHIYVQDENGRWVLKEDWEIPTETLALNAARIRDLIAGKLAPDVNIHWLFKVTPKDDGPYGFDALLEHIANPKLKVVKDPKESERGRLKRELFEARVQFLRLPEAKRTALLEAHAARYEEFRAKSRAEAEELARLRRIRADLTAMFEGKGPGESISALNFEPLSAEDLLFNETRRAAYLGQPTATLSEADQLRNDIDALRKRFWAATNAEQDLWIKPPPPVVEEPEPEPVPEEPQVDPDELERQRKAESEAARAAREREAAIEAARTARTESLRLIASEKAKLLGVKEQHAELSTKFIELEKSVETTTEAALTASRKVRELEGRSVLDGDKESDANKLYDQLIEQLSGIRGDLRSLLTTLQIGQSEVPQTPTLANMPTQLDVPELTALQKLHAELRSAEESLRATESDLLWSQATALRDAMVTVNEARLRLLTQITPSKREALTGFGAPGVAQAVREVEQISLAAQYHILALPRLANSERDLFMASPIVLVGMIVKFLFLTALFIWWRRRADEVLDQLHNAAVKQHQQTDMARHLATVFWYLKRVRGPMEWLLFLWALGGGTAIEGWPEIEFAKIVLLWAFLGSFVIRFVDAVAEHQGDRIEGTSTDALRVKSLRLVGVTVVAVGLTLSVTEASVGRGAIYVWVSGTSWVFAIPIAALLTHWWKDIVFERAARVEAPGTLIQWVNRHRDGLIANVAAAAGGIFLLAEGLGRWAFVQVSDLTVTRRILAYLFRREVEKVASKAAVDHADHPITAQLYAHFEPDIHDIEIGGYMDDQVHATRRLVTENRGTLVAIVGERGLGKTDILNRIVRQIPDDEKLIISVDFSGLPHVLSAFREALGLLGDAPPDAIVEALRQKKYRTIAVDDVHRLIRPVIGGLKEFDALMDIVRAVADVSSCLMTLDQPLWQYVRRARAGQAVFDQVVTLERWSEEAIAEFIGARCKKLGVEPSFERFVAPSQGRQGTRTPDQTRTDFFRILWDYSRGNPSIAMHYWRESLSMRDGSDVVSVRLYRPPTASALADVPGTHHFVLRTLLQLEACGIDQIADCTRLSHSDIRDALRTAEHRNIVEEQNGVFRLSIGWHRAVVDLLVRQHLLGS